MTARRSRLPVFGIVLALLAVLGTSLLCTWHCASFHDDDRLEIAQVERAIGSARPNVPDSPIHLDAHTACQGYVAPMIAGAIVTLQFLALIWPVDKGSFVDGIETSALLRPPQS